MGIFENKKKVSVANLGVTSYAPNIYLSKVRDSDDKLLIAVTEKRTKREIKDLVSFLKKQ